MSERNNGKEERGKDQHETEASFASTSSHQQYRERDPCQR